MNNPSNDQNPAEPPAADGTSPSPAADPELTAPRECPDCTPRALDPLRCRAKGVQAEADYDNQHPGADPGKYEQARLDYGKARHDATPVVAEVRSQLAHVTDQLRCIIDDRETVECLDEAWLEVKERLRVCDPWLGCCVDDDGDFDTDVCDHGIEIIKARIAEYEHRTQAAETCFDDLLKEPDKLTERVANLKAEVAGIASDVGGDPATTDFKRLYARALVAERHLDEVWWGYPYAHDYVDCLCLALRVSLRGRAALSRLTGELAVRVCRIDARQGRCKHLREHIVDGIIEEYVRKCQPRHEHDDGHDRHHEDDDDDDRRRRHHDEDDDDRRRRRRDEDEERERRLEDEERERERQRRLEDEERERMRREEDEERERERRREDEERERMRRERDEESGHEH